MRANTLLLVLLVNLCTKAAVALLPPSPRSRPALPGRRRLRSTHLLSSPSPTPPSRSNPDSMIVLLNFAQEVGSQNERLRQSSDRLRAQFVNSFSQKYDLAKEQLSALAASLANIDDESSLSNEARELRANILDQLNGIESPPRSAVFFNEPLRNLDEYRYNPGIFAKLPAGSVSQPSPAAGTPSQTLTASADVLRRAKSVRESQNPLLLQKQEGDMNRLKTALRVETTKFFVGGGGGKGGEGEKEEEEEQQQQSDADEPLRAQRHAAKATYSQWRDAMEEIEAATRSGNGDGSGKGGYNFAALIQACLLACMATYNLSLDPVLGQAQRAEISAEVKQRIKDVLEGVLVAEPTTGEFAYASAAKMVDSAVAAAAAATEPSLEEQQLKKTQLQRAGKLARMAMGLSPTAPSGGLHLELLSGAKACAFIAHDAAKGLAVVAFRGTKDPVDLITDISFFSSAFEPRSRPAAWVPWAAPDAANAQAGTWKDSLSMEVHSGFLSSFESLRPQLQRELDALPAETEVLFVGHSMGGALAQLAAAFFSDRRPFLVHFGAPAVGNGAFCKYLSDFVHPYGGIRLWNEYDPVPYLALIVGYDHAGIPIKGQISPEVKELYQAESIGALSEATVNLVGPHILYQIGSVVSVFPVMGSSEGGAGEEEEKEVVELNWEEDSGADMEDKEVKKDAAAATEAALPTSPPIATPFSFLETQMPEKQSALELIRWKQQQQRQQRASPAPATKIAYAPSLVEFTPSPPSPSPPSPATPGFRVEDTTPSSDTSTTTEAPEEAPPVLRKRDKIRRFLLRFLGDDDGEGGAD